MIWVARIAITVLVFLFVVIIALTARTLQLSFTSDQHAFSSGTVDQLPDGLYAGTVAGPKNPWLGKKFNLADKTGINLFSRPDGSTAEEYPFVFSVGRGSHDAIQVIRIDYNIPANPFWLRPILDEIVEVSPGKYLGKMQLRIIPGYPFTLTFFKLSLTK